MYHTVLVTRAISAQGWKILSGLEEILTRPGQFLAASLAPGLEEYGIPRNCCGASWNGRVALAGWSDSEAELFHSAKVIPPLPFNLCLYPVC